MHPGAGVCLSRREEEERKREEEERRAAAEEGGPAAAGAGPAAAEAAEAAHRETLRSRGGDGSGGGGKHEPLPACLQGLKTRTIEALGAAGAELRALLRIKVEDDQDLKTAQQALAECGYFLLLLREEAPKRKLSEAALLKKLDLGEG